MSDEDLIDEVLAERDEVGDRKPSRSAKASKRSGAAEVAASPGDTGAQRTVKPRVTAPDDPHFKPDFGTKLGKGRKNQ